MLIPHTTQLLEHIYFSFQQLLFQPLAKGPSSGTKASHRKLVWVRSRRTGENGPFLKKRQSELVVTPWIDIACEMDPAVVQFSFVPFALNCFCHLMVLINLAPNKALRSWMNATGETHLSAGDGGVLEDQFCRTDWCLRLVRLHAIWYLIAPVPVADVTPLV